MGRTKCLVMESGMQIAYEETSEGRMKTPAIIQLQPSEDGRLQIAFSQLMMFAEDPSFVSDESQSSLKSAAILEYNANDETHNGYIQFQEHLAEFLKKQKAQMQAEKSGIVMPQKPSIVLAK